MPPISAATMCGFPSMAMRLSRFTRACRRRKATAAGGAWSAWHRHCAPFCRRHLSCVWRTLLHVDGACVHPACCACQARSVLISTAVGVAASAFADVFGCAASLLSEHSPILLEGLQQAVQAQWLALCSTMIDDHRHTLRWALVLSLNAHTCVAAACRCLAGLHCRCHTLDSGRLGSCMCICLTFLQFGGMSVLQHAQNLSFLPLGLQSWCNRILPCVCQQQLRCYVVHALTDADKWWTNGGLFMNAHTRVGMEWFYIFVTN